MSDFKISAGYGKTKVRLPSTRMEHVHLDFPAPDSYEILDQYAQDRFNEYQEIIAFIITREEEQRANRPQTLNSQLKDKDNGEV